MGKLNLIIKESKLSTVTINYGGEVITFNLSEEVLIKESTLMKELKDQASKYGFALLIHGRLRTRWEQYKAERKATMGRLYRKAKNTIQASTGRPMSDDAAKSYVESHKVYLLINEKCIQAKDEADQVYAVVKSFEQRKDLIQTISSNLRNEKF